MTEAFVKQKIEQAEYRKSWAYLIGYPSLLAYWQSSHPKDCSDIANVASHIHGYFHDERCKVIRPESHPTPHGRCKDKCQIIDDFIKHSLQDRLIEALQKRQYDIGQQILV